MIGKSLVGLAFLGACAVASAQVQMGTIDLYFVGMASNDGAFEWSTGPNGSGMDVFTYCMSEDNYFDPSENPQVFEMWSIAGATAASITASGMLDTNDQPGLTAENFLEAAAEAEADGAPSLTSQYATDNASIHNTETNGDPGYLNADYSHFIYLEQDNPSGYAYPGQPQGLVTSTPGPASAIPMLFGLGGVIARRRKNRKA